MLLSLTFIPPPRIHVTNVCPYHWNVGLTEAVVTQRTLLVHLQSSRHLRRGLAAGWRRPSLVVYGHHHATREGAGQTPGFGTPEPLPTGSVTVHVDVIHATDVMF